MTSSSLIKQESQSTPSQRGPSPVFGLVAVAATLAAAGAALMGYVAWLLLNYNNDNLASVAIAIVLCLGGAYPFMPVVRAIKAGRKRSKLVSENHLVAARRTAASGREEAFIGMGYTAAVLIVGAVLTVSLTNKTSGIAFQYFTSRAWRLAFPEMLAAFWTNVWVALVAQVIVLVLGLLLAVMRMLPGRAGAPLRLIAMIYCDIFRAVPAIVVILLIVFGTPLALPVFVKANPVYLGIVALSLSYSAYVAEVYRAGLASIHPSQSAAARSLGLSYGQTLRRVLIPQAVRRVIPPLLNDFISLQKDTALLSTAGIAEVVLTATLWQSKLFNLSPITLGALFFIIITIPQARLVDWLIHRDASRKAGG